MASSRHGQTREMASRSLATRSAITGVAGEQRQAGLLSRCMLRCNHTSPLPLGFQFSAHLATLVQIFHSLRLSEEVRGI